MVKRLFVQGLSSYTSEQQLRAHFERFGELYECVLPPAPKYSVVDTGPDDEEIEARSSIRYEKFENAGVFDDEDLTVERYDEQKHGDFDKYMRKIGEGDTFRSTAPSTCPKIAGYAYITFVTMDGFSRCMNETNHQIDGIPCHVELAKVDGDEEPLKLESRRLFVSYFPLERLSSKELKNNFGAFGKISDVEFVSDSEGPLHFCIITFEDPKSVDVILKKSLFIRDVRMFVRRAVVKENIKIAEQKRKEMAANRMVLPPNHTAYPIRQPRIQPVYNPPPPQIPEHSELPGYGYGPRKW